MYNPATISRLKHFLTTPHGGHGTVVMLSQQIQDQTTAGLRNKLEDILEGDATVRGRGIYRQCHVAANEFAVIINLMLAKYTLSYFVLCLFLLAPPLIFTDLCSLLSL